MWVYAAVHARVTPKRAGVGSVLEMTEAKFPAAAQTFFRTIESSHASRDGCVSLGSGARTHSLAIGAYNRPPPPVPLLDLPSLLTKG